MDRILIIEDEMSIAELEKDYLEKYEFEAIIADNGDTGLKLALEQDFDLVILDLMIPGKNGYVVCNEIREKKNIPIIIVSAKKEDFDKINGLEMGADDYITKPFSPGELVARVRAHLARYNRLVGENKSNNAIIEIRGIRIDKTARRVYVEGEEVLFTSREFELLLFLVNNPNRVFSKKELFKQVWEADAIGDVATVTVHVKKIREKIERNHQEHEYIETIWGVGYRFKV